MSVNITLNGKYIKSCPKHNLLDDPERVRKETENERRKMRIQQVRAMSKNVAKKVRDDVELEKEKQLKKLEEIKAQEMEMWRQKVLAEQKRDFRSAIFQVGTAHRAAQEENARQAQKTSHENPKRSLKRPKVVTLAPKVGKENVLKNVNVQTDITGKCYPKPSVPVKERAITYSVFEEDSDEDTITCISSELSSDILLESTSQSSDSVVLRKTEYSTTEVCREGKSNRRHQRMIPVFDLQPESEDVADNRIESTKKTPKKQKSKTKDKQEFKSTTEELLTAPSTSAAARKRFTQISDIIRQQNAGNEEKKQTIEPPQQSDTSGIQKSPRKPTPKPSITTQQLSGTTRSKSKSPAKAHTKSPTSSRPVSTQTAGSLATKSSSCIQTQRSSAARVQFYDYNNKFHKQYEQSASAVEIHELPTEGAQMNAMEQAELAAQLRESREVEMEKLRQRSDERCQKAIEREQVRRACEDLTAKLDALTKQRLVLPSDNHQFSSVRLGQVAAEKETKRNNAIEDILKRPAVITCPEVNRQQPAPTAIPSDAQRSHAFDLNLGSAFTRNEMNSLNSSDSCCSILLGYVNGQSKQIADDIKKYNNQAGETDKAKAEKLQNLLNRINRLRENLIAELEKCSTPTADKERVQSLVDSISEFRKERESILIDDNSKDSISRREKELKKKEAILEKKLREFYEVQRAAKKKDKKGSADEDSKLTLSVENGVAESENLRSVSKEKSKAGIAEERDVKSGSVQLDKVGSREIGNGEVEAEGVGTRSKKPHKVGTAEEGSENASSGSEVPYNVGRRKEKIGDAEKESKKHEKTSSKDVLYRDVLHRARKSDDTEKKAKDVRNERSKSKSDRNVIREQESEERLLSSEEYSEEEIVERRELFVGGEKPVEIVIKLKSDIKSKKSRKVSAKSPRRLSTLVQSPNVKKSRKKLPVVRSTDSSSTSYRSLPPTIHNNVDELITNVPKSVQTDAYIQSQLRKEEKHRLKKQSSNLNPLMAHYIQRLLGMSRASINALEVNSSDVDTPSSSIMNQTANLSAEETERLASNRLDHVQKFIEDNYSFIDEVEESFRQSKSTDSSLKTIEVIWKKALQEHKSKKKDTEQKTKTEKTEKTIKSTLKKPSKKQKPHFSQDRQRADLIDKSTQLTDNCNQRIAELTQMINKVRQEKQKILETTLSSVSETGRNSTEYLDLPDRQNNSGESTSRILDSQIVKSSENLQTESPETAPQLEKNKSTGKSRDSGISLSRPITVQESRDSPTEDLPHGQSSTESLSNQFKKPKPPISIARYSPELVEDIPHELSTIFEVETPGTSRINTSIHANNGQEQTAPKLHDERAEKISYKKFPTFEEYARLYQLDLSQLDPEFSMQFEKEFNEFLNLARAGKVIDYEEFASFSKYFGKSSSGDDKEAAEELLASLKLVNLSFKKFPTRKEYLEKIGVSTADLIDSQSLDNAEESRNVVSNSSSTESLINVEKELKLRKILTKSFRRNTPSDGKSSSAANPSLALTSPRKEKKIYHADISGIRQLTSGAPSTEEQSDNLENELKRLGIKWPSAMMKKARETQALSSSTSSSLEQPPFNARRKPPKLSYPVETSFRRETRTTYETTTQTEDGGRQLNLREFLTKELLKRTTSPSSFSFSDDSIASSILRSIIGSMTPSPPQQVNGAGPNLERHKTSTPMASQSTSSGQTANRSQGGTSSVQLFSGESRLSSVHFNNSSKDANQIPGNVDAESNTKN